jgi:hypothetical protein
MRSFKFLFFTSVALLSITSCKQKEYYMPEPAAPSARVQFIIDMKAKTGGDINKLTPEERKKMDEITHGMTEIALRGNYTKRN